jgi:hypothetical protein
VLSTGDELAERRKLDQFITGGTYGNAHESAALNEVDDFVDRRRVGQQAVPPAWPA